MLSIKTKLKINQMKQSIDRNICKMLRFIFKPLIVFENKVDNYKYKKKSNKLKKLSSQLTDEEVVKLVAKDVIKGLIRYPKFEEHFDYKYEYNSNDIISYIHDMKNEVIHEWCYNETRIYDDTQEIVNRLMPLLKQELLKYPEIEFKDYQKGKYYPKKLIIKLKEDDK